MRNDQPLGGSRITRTGWIPTQIRLHLSVCSDVILEITTAGEGKSTALIRTLVFGGVFALNMAIHLVTEWCHKGAGVFGTLEEAFLVRVVLVSGQRAVGWKFGHTD